MTQTDIWSEAYISDLQDNDLDSFKNIVIADIKFSITEDQKAILLNNLTLWNYNLQILRRDIELQLACQKAKTKMQKQALKTATALELDDINAFIAEQEKWRMSALKFLSNIERRSLYVKMLMAETT
jgi:hypothetical protein